MVRRIAIVLTVLGRVAAADCPSGGETLLQIQRGIAPEGKPHELATSKTTLFATGAWSFVEERDGKVARTATGCVEPALLHRISDELSAAAWKRRPNPTRCIPQVPRFVRYVVRGKVVWTDTLCGGEVLDDASHRRLETARGILDGVTPR